MKPREILTGIFFFFASIFAIVYLMIQMITGLTSDVSYEYASYQTFENALEKTCYIVRSEEILYSNTNGILSYNVSESQKIGIDQLVATVYSDTQGIDIQKQIDSIESKLLMLKRSSVDTGFLTSDITKIDSRINSTLVKALESIENKDFSLVQKYKEELLINMNKRELITAGKGDFSGQIADLTTLKAELTSSLQDPISSIFAKKSGYFSTLVDGYETIFKPENLDTMTISDFDEMIKAEKVTSDSSAIGKLITDFDWHTLCEVTATESEDMIVGRKYPVTFLNSSDFKLNAILERKITHSDSDRVVLVLRMEDVPSGFDFTRCQTLKIILDSKSGVSFPSSALRMIDGKQGVYVIAGNVVKFKYVEIIDSSNSNFLSKTPDENTENASEYLSKFDRVITKGKDLYVGKILN